MNINFYYNKIYSCLNAINIDSASLEAKILIKYVLNYNKYNIKNQYINIFYIQTILTYI